MKRLVKKTMGIIKGVPSAVLLSALIHLILLSIAGGLVVFSVVQKMEKKFVPPPPVDRPKMELKKPQVKVKKTSAPPAARHIVSKTVQAMPELQLPDVTGISASGIGGGLGGFDLVPDVSELSWFGGTKSTSPGNDFEGTFYILNRTRDGKYLGFDPQGQLDKVTKFIENEWSPNAFAEYYRSPQKLYTTQFIVPLTPSIYGPRAFGIALDPRNDFPEWVAHYKGKIRSKKGGQYRFWGVADEILFVRINGKLVLNGSFDGWQRNIYDWGPEDKMHLQYVLMPHAHASIGHWFTLEPGEVVDMEVLIGDVNVPHFGVFLLIEDKAESAYYSRRKLDNMPLLPVFRTAEMSQAMKDQIKYEIYTEEMDLDGGELFNVY